MSKLTLLAPSFLCAWLKKGRGLTKEGVRDRERERERQREREEK